VTLPVGHVVLASGAFKWAPPQDVEYVLCSALYDPVAKTMRLVLEGVDDLGDEVRSVFYWDAGLSEWACGDYARRHAILMPFEDTDEEAWS
jgi:hypothetical protein